MRLWVGVTACLLGNNRVVYISQRVTHYCCLRHCLDKHSPGVMGPIQTSTLIKIYILFHAIMSKFRNLLKYGFSKIHWVHLKLHFSADIIRQDHKYISISFYKELADCSFSPGCSMKTKLRLTYIIWPIYWL